MTHHTVGTVEGVEATVRVEDGRVALAGQTADTLRVAAPDPAPLSVREPHASLSLTGEGVTVTLDLAGDALPVLRRALAVAADDATAPDEGDGEGDLGG